MNRDASRHIHWSFWVVCVFGLLWNIGGAINFIMQTNPEFVASLPDTHRAIIEARPFWATAGFALGVFGGAIGCLLLMLRMSLAFYIFILSLFGIVTTMIHTVNVHLSKISFTMAEIIVMILLPVLVAIFLTWYTRLVLRKIV